MLMYIFKNNKDFYNNYYKIYDIKKHKLTISYSILFIVLLNAIFSPAPSNYLQSISQGYHLVSCDMIYEYTLPLISAFFMIYVFYKDYTTKIYELIAFYNRKTFNYILFFRWLIYSLTFSLGSFITGLIYYRDVSFFSITNILLSIRFIPNILFLSSLVLVVMCFFKNVYAAILVLTSYYCIDLLSSGSMFKVFSLGAHTNNFYYGISSQYYILNRLIFISLSCIFVFISCKISSKA